MESKELPTAEEYLRITAKSYGYAHLGEFSPQEMARCMVEFAKHIIRKEMIEAIKEKIEIITIDEHGQDCCYIDMDSIENAYREEEIK